MLPVDIATQLLGTIAHAAGTTAIADASSGLALVAADFLADSNLRAAARADFDAAGGALDVEGFFS